MQERGLQETVDRPNERIWIKERQNCVHQLIERGTKELFKTWVKLAGNEEWPLDQKCQRENQSNWVKN